jgi:hypothetical protein
MPKKPEKWGIKFWVLANSVSKFIYCFEIYCGKNLEAEIQMSVPCGEASAAYGVVMKLLSGLEGKGHCVVIDNYFCSIPLFEDLVRKGIYAGLSKRTSYAKNYHPDVRFVRTSARVRVYPAAAG